MLNSIGLQNPGIDAFLRENLPRLAALGVPVWVSVGGFSAADYARRLRAARRARRRRDDRAEPLVPERRGGARDRRRARRRGPRGRRASRCTRSSRPRRGTSPSPRARSPTAGADGLSLVNTIRGLALDAATRRPKLARGAGGYSGPALTPDRAGVRPRLRGGRRAADRRHGWRRLRGRRARLRGSRRERGRARNGPLLGPVGAGPHPRGARAPTSRADADGRGSVGRESASSDRTVVSLRTTQKVLQIG